MMEIADDLFIFVMDRKTMDYACALQSDGNLFYIAQNVSLAISLRFDGWGANISGILLK